MPEGPEVEYTLRTLKELEGKKIKSIDLTEISQKYNKYKGRQDEFTGFSKSILSKIERHGKFLIWIFNNNEVILNHLGMSGKWIISSKSEDNLEIKHAKVIIVIEDSQTSAIFDDARNFGQFRKFGNYEMVMRYSPIRRLGLDGLKLPFPILDFQKALKQSKNLKKAIGRVLLDQTIVAGIGNIYKSESLFRAKINPLRTVKSLKSKETEVLGKAISEILQKAVQSMGSTIHTYRNPYGEEGSAQKWHEVYGKAGKLCKVCGTEITRIVQEKRSTFYCGKCQL
ncbi:MAG: bifunctional DNA-formamidopyrimidine glycosylase/DNA-(apurinic or apyrimidinic site) lyase [Candidatus Heimdallarchaeota archaeon]|nr:bifunctional DNA-formamidopyrimidine glycosylase/DNA-(apurinic or apyrimidinic site) lyase [Candidatus Heimdallarchaeota archaeon]